MSQILDQMFHAVTASMHSHEHITNDATLSKLRKKVLTMKLWRDKAEWSYLVQWLNEATVIAKCRHYQQVVLLVYIKDRLYVDFRILEITTKHTCGQVMTYAPSTHNNV